MSASALDEKQRLENRRLRRVGDSKAGGKEGEGKSPFGSSRDDTIGNVTKASLPTSSVAESRHASKQQQQQPNKDYDAKSQLEEVALRHSTSSSIAQRRQQWKEGQLDGESFIEPPDKEALDKPGAFRAGGDSDDKSSSFLKDDKSEFIKTEETDYLVSATVVEEEPEREIVPAVLIEQHQQDAEQQLSSALDELEKVRKKDAARRRMIKVALIVLCFVIIIVVAVVVILVMPGDKGSNQIRQDSIKLMASVQTFDDDFGCSVAIDANGTTVAVAAEDDNGNTGTVYIFSRSGEAEGGLVWRQEVKVTASDATTSDYFGTQVALSMDGNTLLVGATQEGHEGGGYVSIFTRTQNGWTEQAKLVPEIPTDDELFGATVAISQDTIVVGAINENEINSGSIYVFTQSEGAWNQKARLSPEDAIDASCAGTFGTSIATSLDGNIIVVGADRCGTDGIAHGNVYVFEKTLEGSWRQEAKLAPADIQPGDGFGFSVDICTDGTTIVVGSPGDDDDIDSLDTGSFYIFKRVDGTWNEHAKLTAASKEVGVMLGQTVKIDGDARTIVAGAHGPAGGYGYVFAFSGDKWTEEIKLISPDSNLPTDFGLSIALSQDGRTTVFGAAPDIDGFDTIDGSAYVFQL